MDRISDFLQETRKRTQPDEIRSSSEEEGWTRVEKKKKRAKPNPQNVTVPRTATALPRFNKFKVIAANSTEAYRSIAQLTSRNKELKLIAKPNLRSEWIVTPLTIETYTALKSITEINLEELKFEDKTKKAIVVGFPMDLPEAELTKHSQITSAIRMKNKQGILTKTMLCTFIGKIPEKIDLRPWGKFATKTYYPEPLRCYNCQRYGHHRSACTAPAICAVCSGRHTTDQCINKHKEGHNTNPKCPNCKQDHPAWHRRCPARINRIQAALPKDKPVTPAQGRQVPVAAASVRVPKPVARPVGQPEPEPQPRKYTREHVERARSLSKSRIPVPEEEPRRQLPQTIYIEQVPAKREVMKYTSAVLRSIGLETSQDSLNNLADLLMYDLLRLSKPISTFQTPSVPQPPTSLPVTTSSTTTTSRPIPSSSSSTTTISYIQPASSSSSPTYHLPKPLSTRPKQPQPNPNPNPNPNPSSNTDFPPLKPSQHSYSFHPTTKPFPTGTTITQAAAAASGLTTPDLKLVSFKGKITRRRDPRLEKSRTCIA